MMGDDDWTKPVFKGDDLSLEPHHDLEEAWEDGNDDSEGLGESEAAREAAKAALEDALRGLGAEDAEAAGDDTGGDARDS